MKHRLWLMCGVPGSGKSTWIKNHINYFNEPYIVSRDIIRFSLVKEGEPYFSKEKEVWHKFVKDAIWSLHNNIDTILDATHISYNSRRKILGALKNHLKDVEVNIIAFDCPLELALERNENREGMAYVPSGAIESMYNSFTIPEVEEGFDHVYVCFFTKNNKLFYKIYTK